MKLYVSRRSAKRRKRRPVKKLTRKRSTKPKSKPPRRVGSRKMLPPRPVPRPRPRRRLARKRVIGNGPRLRHTSLPRLSPRSRRHVLHFDIVASAAWRKSSPSACLWCCSARWWCCISCRLTPNPSRRRPKKASGCRSISVPSSCRWCPRRNCAWRR